MSSSSVGAPKRGYAGYEPTDIVVTEAMMRDARAVAGKTDRGLRARSMR
jgi:hypothetical protein